jgi:hypothetical protein
VRQNDELARVKIRIRALTERTVDRGCTEAEAMAAADMVGKLLERYALTMDEVDVRQEPCVQIEVPMGGVRRRPIDACVPAIARFCDCKVWLTRRDDEAIYVFFGFETDTALAAYLFNVVDTAIKGSMAQFHNGKTGIELRRARNSFQHGMAARIAERLGTMHAQREAAVSAQRPTGTALTIVRHSVVEEAFKASNVQLHALRGLTTRRNAAFSAGREAGEQVNLNRPVGHNDRNRLA